MNRCEICGQPAQQRLCFACTASLDAHELEMAALRRHRGVWVYACSDQPCEANDSLMYHLRDCGMCRLIAGRQLQDHPDDPHAQCLAKLFEPPVVVATGRREAA